MRISEVVAKNATNDVSLLRIQVEPHKKGDAKTSIHNVDSILEMAACMDPGPRSLCLWVNLFY